MHKLLNTFIELIAPNWTMSMPIKIITYNISNISNQLILSSIIQMLSYQDSLLKKCKLLNLFYFSRHTFRDKDERLIMSTQFKFIIFLKIFIITIKNSSTLPITDSLCLYNAFKDHNQDHLILYFYHQLQMTLDNDLKILVQEKYFFF